MGSRGRRWFGESARVTIQREKGENKENITERIKNERQWQVWTARTDGEKEQ